MPVAAASPALLHPHGFLTESCTNNRSQGKKHAGERSGYPCHVDIKPASGVHQAANAAGQYERPSAVPEKEPHSQPACHCLQKRDPAERDRIGKDVKRKLERRILLPVGEGGARKIRRLPDRKPSGTNFFRRKFTAVGKAEQQIQQTAPMIRHDMPVFGSRRQVKMGRGQEVERQIHRPPDQRRPQQGNLW